ncbi:hypothetical protein [Nitrospirillum viridazoti]|uniref:GNAT family N-acetyltransferase n=1 Tax=Nitrospirillum viridazoti CBAmc TaxID=1441467 RepID=A0A248JTE7_9PROT|nr:hypothetical protein [Nitrospirillum amazonense]ASG21388.1 hypothetical protein Y958_11535 [Nitrospirillum amazonense CBAmc]TWB33065.1 hypothetical protein FBZ91_115127 [Nitrospirillum amazonense]
MHHYDAQAVQRAAVAAVAAANLTVVVDSDFDVLAAYNKAAPPSWYPIIPLYDPELDPPDPGTALVVRAVDATGETRACIAARLRHVPNGLGVAMADGTFMFGASPPRECQVMLDADGLGGIAGFVAIPGGMYVHPDVRHRDLAYHLYTVLAAEMYGRWHPDWVVGFVAPKRTVMLGYDVYRMRTALGYMTVTDPRWPYGDGAKFVILACSLADLRRRYLRVAPGVVDELPALAVAAE